MAAHCNFKRSPSLLSLAVLLLLVDHACCAPLQLESIQPVGLSPASRHSHVSVVIPSEQGLLFMFGGYTLNGGVGTVNNDVWAYDQAAQGWEEVKFPATVLGCDLPAAAQTLLLPPKRAGHGIFDAHGCDYMRRLRFRS